MTRAIPLATERKRLKREIKNEKLEAVDSIIQAEPRVAIPGPRDRIKSELREKATSKNV